MACIGDVGSGTEHEYSGIIRKALAYSYSPTDPGTNVKCIAAEMGSIIRASHALFAQLECHIAGIHASAFISISASG
jgi:hypothetical protein